MSHSVYKLEGPQTYISTTMRKEAHPDQLQTISFGNFSPDPMNINPTNPALQIQKMDVAVVGDPDDTSFPAKIVFSFLMTVYGWKDNPGSQPEIWINLYDSDGKVIGGNSLCMGNFEVQCGWVNQQQQYSLPFNMEYWSDVKGAGFVITAGSFLAC